MMSTPKTTGTVDLMTVDEAARMLRLAPITVRMMLSRGKFQRVKIGRKTRLSLRNIREVVAADTQLGYERGLAKQVAREGAANPAQNVAAA